MKEIQPKQIWFNGTEYTASVILYYGTWDNNINQCIYYYALFTGTIEQTEIKLVTGNLTMDNPEYTEYNTSADSNEYAKNWIQSKLGVTII